MARRLMKMSTLRALRDSGLFSVSTATSPFISSSIIGFCVCAERREGGLKLEDEGDESTTGATWFTIFAILSAVADFIFSTEYQRRSPAWWLFVFLNLHRRAQRPNDPFMG